MDPFQAIHQLESWGVSLALAPGGGLSYDGPSEVLTDDQLDWLAAEKSSIVEALRIIAEESDRDEPPHLLATEPPPDIPLGWTMADWHDWIRAGGDPRPEMVPALESVA